ncbi:3-dehydroquinate dehydratase [uncultured archaeon]|nr:3-dehydroquinate dehydratase [uncultured archaeon]
MIFVSIAEPTLKGCLDALKGAAAAEIRLDAMDVSEKDVEKIFQQKARLIATCRPGSKSEGKRKSLLLAAIDAGAAYVDVEVDASDAYKNEIAKGAKARNCKIIVSYHNYEKTPGRAELDQIVGWCFESGADIAKIACKSNSDADNARLLGLLDTDRKMIVIGMGEKGKITRIAAPLLGSELTFASASKGKETADGQIDSKKLEKLMGELEDA